ncbi:septum formation protein Maf [bacterium]|nr:septum formation protein Maf [bacterium]NIN91592.1 septum formation protein Maf [bacterium]NIO17956.1 septum formation protein Maf [bacterium]NIO73724.1 septum formation protein Maf [bacterium]
MKRLILASSSSRRQQILSRLGLKFQVMPSCFSEEHPVSSTGKSVPWKIAEKLALRKAKEVSKRVSEGLVIGADTIVALPTIERRKFEIIGKPQTVEEAKQILRRLGGTTHEVYTGIAIVDAETGRKVVGHEVSTVRMKKLTSRELSRVSGMHLDKAGAYGVKQKNDVFVKLLEGSMDNVVGMPRKLFKELLKKFGVKV